MKRYRFNLNKTLFNRWTTFDILFFKRYIWFLVLSFIPHFCNICHLKQMNNFFVPRDLLLYSFFFNIFSKC